MGKCDKCYRRGDCKLRDLAALTLPWVIGALRVHEKSTVHDRQAAVARVLRGNEECPGFLEDIDGCGDRVVHREDVDSLVKHVAGMAPDRVTIEDLCSLCRRRQGPSGDR